MSQFLTFLILMMLPFRSSCLLSLSSRRAIRLHIQVECPSKYDGLRDCWRSLRVFSTLQEEGDEPIIQQSSSNLDSHDDVMRNNENMRTGTNTNSTKSRRHKHQPMPPPPGPETFPLWAYEPRSYFEFELLYESKKSLARVGRIHTVCLYLFLIVAFCLCTVIILSHSTLSCYYFLAPWSH